MKKSITISQSLYIKASQEEVWNFTQNFGNRYLWDHVVLKSEMIQKKPFKLVRLKMKGGLQTVLKYKLCRKPFKTSLVMTNTKSFLFKGGGGSWTYKTENKIVEWTQVNTLIIKNSVLYWCFGALVKNLMLAQTKVAMTKAKKMIEEQAKNLK